MYKFILILCLLIMGCGTPINDGIIISKTFEPEHTESTLTYDPITESWGTEYYDVPDKWFVTFEKLNEQNKKVQRTIEISQATYDSLVIGKYYRVK